MVYPVWTWVFVLMALQLPAWQSQGLPTLPIVPSVNSVVSMEP